MNAQVKQKNRGKFTVAINMRFFKLSIRLALFLCFTLQSLALFAEEKSEEHAPPKEEAKAAPAKEEKKAEAPPAAKGKDPKAEVTPLPRRIKAPKLYFDSVDDGKRVEHDYKKHRYTFAGILGTWNRRSSELVKLIEPYIPELNRRGITAIGVFSHDTRSSIIDFKKVTSTKLLLGLAPVEFVDELQNPKVPTFWLANNQGNTLFYSELPSDKEIIEILQKLLRWTDF